MSRLQVRLCSQEGIDSSGLLQSHQWAEVPDAIAGPLLTGGLKKIRRMVEIYFTFRFGSGAEHVRGIWRAGEPTLLRRSLPLPFARRRTIVALGRLRSAGTLDAYRGYHEVRGGEAVSPAAQLDRRPWPTDLPWVAPSAGEFIDKEKDRPYYGIFEIRVERTANGCLLHTYLVDFPLADRGAGAALMDKAWSPLRSTANLEFLRAQVQQLAKEAGIEVALSPVALAGMPKRPRFRLDRHDAESA